MITPTAPKCGKEPLQERGNIRMTPPTVPRGGKQPLQKPQVDQLNADEIFL